MRPELTPLPRRMTTLPVDERGYPVPWFVQWLDGKPEFRVMSAEKYRLAIKDRRCWTCGERLGRFITFVAGPMCGINRTSSEPPNHLECAEWAVRNCPWLNNPEATRRVGDGEIVNADPERTVGGIAITRNPGVAMLWTTKDYTVWPDGKGGQLITMGEPEHVEWYREGRAATRDEVEESIATGLPALVALASREDGGLKYLDEQRTRFARYLPQ